MNILIDGHTLHILGGMERVVCDLASAMAARGHQVFLFISEPLPKKPMYTLDVRVRCVQYTHNGRQGHMPAFRRQILACAPDVCISPAADRRHVPWCAALQGTGIPLIISEHGSPEAVENLFMPRPERLAVMAAADAIHLLRPSCIATLPEALRERAVVIPNAVTMPVLPKVQGKAPTIISLGRLEKDKQNHLLIDAFALLAAEIPAWRVEIWGEGPEKARLHKSIVQHGLHNTVFLPGRTAHPEQCYAGAVLVCMPSRHEGFGCVVTEAMTAGLPVVGFAACPGVNELVVHGHTGVLAPEMTAQSLAAALRTLMMQQNMREAMGVRAREAAVAWSSPNIYALWEDVLTRTAARKGATRLQAMRNPAALPADMREYASVLAHCVSRPNVLMGDGQWLRRIVFALPWLKRVLHPLYARWKAWRA